MTGRPRLLGMLVARDEAGRYLSACLDWLRHIVDGACLWDDQSADDTVRVAHELGVVARSRPDHVPAFLEDEAAFRQAGWEWMEATLRPRPGDWVLAVDCDEALVADVGAEVAVVRDWMAAAERVGSPGVLVDVAEVWNVLADGTPQVRVDGWWGSGRACRLVAWQPDGTFRRPGRPGPVGCGAVPTYADQVSVLAAGLHLLHYGYATGPDRHARHLRYSQHRGHNPAHVRSIAEPAVLEVWGGRHPPRMRPPL